MSHSGYSSSGRRSGERARSSSRSGYPSGYGYSTSSHGHRSGSHSRHGGSGGGYLVADNGTLRRHASAGYAYAPAPQVVYAAPSSSGHHRAHSRSPVYYTSSSASGGGGGGHHRGRSASVSAAPAYVDARSTHYPHDDRRSHRSSSHGHRRAQSQDRYRDRGHGHAREHEHETFGEKMRRLFGLGPSEHHEHGRRRDVYYADPHTGREASTFGKAYRSKKMEFMDAVTGREVDKKGRPIYTV